MLRTLLLLCPVLLMGCDTSFCGAYTQEVDGVCVGEAPPEPAAADTLDALLLDQHTCTPVPAGTGLDLDARCVEGVCVGMTADEATAASGAPPVCEATWDDTAECSWYPGVVVSFADFDGDGAPDSGDAPVLNIQVTDDYDGSSSEGLGVQATMGCFLDELGAPDRFITGKTYLGDAFVAIARWEADGVAVGPSGAVAISPTFDGPVRQLLLFEPE